MISIVLDSLSQKLPAEVASYFNGTTMDYSGPGLVPESRRFALIDGTMDGFEFDKAKAVITGKGGWTFHCQGWPILLFEDKNKILLFFEPSLQGMLNGEKYKLILVEKHSGKLIREKIFDLNPSSMMIHGGGLYVFWSQPTKKVELFPL